MSKSKSPDKSLDGSLGFQSRLLDKDYANFCLKYGVEVLKGYGVIARNFWARKQVALAIKENLELFGWTWQAERLENWIHFFEREQKDLEAREARP